MHSAMVRWLLTIKGFTMVKTTKQAAQAFNGANGASAPVNVAAMVAFIKANGIGNVGLQLTPAALANGVLFGGGAMWRAMQPNKAGVISARGVILWACVNGVPTHTLQGVQAYNPKGIICKVPTAIGKPVPLAAIQAAHQHWQASVYANANSSGATNQNAVAALLNGGFNYSAQTAATYGTAFASLVVTG